MLKKILLTVAVALALFLGFVATRDDHYRVERSLTMRAPADVVFAHIEDFHAWGEWSPWEKLDPTMKKTFSGPERALGSSYAWQGNDQVGSGSMTITELAPPTHFSSRLKFKEPFESEARNGFELTPKGQMTEVTWWMEGENNFVSKLFGVLMNMDKMIGADFEKGLKQLSAVSEADAARRKAASVTPPAASP